MTEHNIFEEIQEDLERQKLEALWKRYGSLILAAAIAIVVITGGVSAWQSWRLNKNQQATSGLIEAMNIAQTDAVKEIDALEDFAKKNPHVTQATFAQFRAAAVAAQNGQQDRAVKIYDSISQDESVDPAFRQLADLMYVRTQMDVAAPADLQKRLQPLLDDKSPWHFTAMEYSGYLALRQNDKAKAQKIFSDLSQNAGAPASLVLRASDMARYVAE